MASATRYDPGYVGGYPPIRAAGSQPAGGGSATYPAQGAVPPGAPALWYDAQDINLLGNSGVSDSDPVGTWKNKGSVGASADVVQGTANNRPLFKLVAAAGKLNNLSAVRGDGINDVLLSGTITQLNQPNLVCAVVRRSAAAVDAIWFDGRIPTQRNILACLGASDANHIKGYAGGYQGDRTSVQDAYHMVVATFNGGSSAMRVDLSAATFTNPGTQYMDGATLFCNNDLANYMNGDIVEILLYNGSLPTVASVEAYFSARYGASWPQ